MPNKNEKKELTPQEKFQLQLQMEAELGRLQRQVRLILKLYFMYSGSSL